MMDSSGGGGQEVELNLAPIIDCFTVLITYLLVTASFITLGAVDVGVSANNPSIEAPPPITDKPPMVLNLDLNNNNEIILKVSGGDLTKEVELKIPAKNGGREWDSETLTKRLTDVKARWSKVSEVSVNVGPDIKYKELVNVINVTQKTLPKVYISGG